MSVTSAVVSHPWLVVTTLVLAPVVWYLMHFVLWMRKMKPIWEVLEKNFPGPEKHWLLGNMHQHPGPSAEGIQYGVDLTNKYGKAYLIWFLFYKPVLQIVHPDIAKAFFKSSHTVKPRGLLGNYSLLFPWIGDGLLLSNKKKWQRNRRMLTPGFHYDVLKPYMKIYNEASDIFLEKMAKASEGGEPIEIYTPVNLLTLNVIMRCAFSFEEDVQTIGTTHPYVSAVNKIASQLLYRVFNPIFVFDWLYYLTPGGREFSQLTKYSKEVSDKLISSRLKQLKKNPETDKRYKDFLDILLLARDEDGNGLSHEEIRDEVDTFLFEGHDTTASGISWILQSLAAHPEVQEKARAEVDSVLDGRETDELEWEDLNSFPYTLQCIKESLRINPPVVFIGRELTEAITVDGVTLPAGTTADIHIHQMHHNEHVWGQDYKEYKPERFNHENIKTMDPYAFVPFSAGSRNCIGQSFAMHEIKVAVVRMLRRFVMETIPDKPAIQMSEIVMRAEHGIHLKLTPRDHKTKSHEAEP